MSSLNFLVFFLPFSSYRPNPTADHRHPHSHTGILTQQPPPLATISLRHKMPPLQVLSPHLDITSPLYFAAAVLPSCYRLSLFSYDNRYLRPITVHQLFHRYASTPRLPGMATGQPREIYSRGHYQVRREHHYLHCWSQIWDGTFLLSTPLPSLTRRSLHIELTLRFL